MKTTAAVLVELRKPLVLADLEIPILQPGQSLVEIACTGVCHTQLLEARGYRGEDRFLPHCLGHEGSGVVLETGPGVTKVKPGNRVILSWIKGSGMDVHGAHYRWDGRTVNSGAITTFGRHSVIGENRLTVCPDDLSFRDAAVVGCAVPTGMGVIFNAARPSPGDSLAVFGAGGIGLCAIAGAAAAGCSPILALDVRENKLPLARQMGATHTLPVHGPATVEDILKICPGGLDFAVEASGRPEAMLLALHSVRNQGGTAVVIGNARFGEVLTFDPKQLNLGKRLLGTWGGDNWPDRDFPRYCRLIRAGRLKVDLLLSAPYRLDQINAAFDDLEAGRVARPLIDMSKS